MNQVVPKYVLVSIRRCDLLGIGKKSIIVHIHSIADTGFGCWIVFMNYIIDLRFFDLSFGPIRETRLWISLPATITSFRAMVTNLWDRGCDAFELFGIDSCELNISTMIDGWYPCDQKNRPSSRSIHGQGAEGAACRWEGCGTRFKSSCEDSCSSSLFWVVIV